MEINSFTDDEEERSLSNIYEMRNLNSPNQSESNVPTRVRSRSFPEKKSDSSVQTYQKEISANIRSKKKSIDSHTNFSDVKPLNKFLIVETKEKSFFIICCLGKTSSTGNERKSSSSNVSIIAINPNSGNLEIVDKFDSDQSAIQYLQDANFSIQNISETFAIIGYIVFGSTGNLLIASKVRPDVSLFGGHTIFTIEEKKWISIPLLFFQHQNKAEQKNLELLYEFPFEGLHYYCETFDLTHPFPSPFPVHKYDPEFCWNSFLANSFETIGLREACVVLLQGMALGRTLPVIDGQSINVCLITKKSNKNPGTRFYAKGLQEQAGVGNEMECELLMFSPITNEKIFWCSYVWRRGTIPIWWKSEAKSQVVKESDFNIRTENPFEKSEIYFENLLNRYGLNQSIILVNLLRSGPQQDEAILTQYYEESIKHVKKFLSIDIKMVSFDWHHKFKQLSNEKAVEEFWTSLKEHMKHIDMNEGVISLYKTGNHYPVGMQLSPDGRLPQFQQSRSQSGILRFNCADSLDRTNISNFFLSFQIVGEMLTRLGVPLDLSSSKLTSLGSWFLLDLSLKQVVRSLRRIPILPHLAEFFVINGDISSLLYTNSSGIHSNLMRDYSPNISSPPFDAIMNLQRKYSNLYKDPTRQAQYEMILGINKEKYFPSKTGKTIECVSDFPSWCIKPIPSALGEINPDCIIHCDNFCWICPNECDIAEVYIFLKEPCEIKELVLTVIYGNSDENTARFLDLFVGPYLDKQLTIFQGLALPKTMSDTQLCYNISGSMWKTGNIHDFDVGSDISLSPLIRVVRLIFRGAQKNSFLILPRIQLFGSFSSIQNPIQEKIQLYSTQISSKIDKIEALLVPNEEEPQKHRVKIVDPSLNSDYDISLVDHISHSLDKISTFDDFINVPLTDAQNEYKIKIQNLKANLEIITFLDCLELENFRLEKDISPQQRDNILLSLNLDIEQFNPDRFVYPRDEKAEASLRKSRKYKTANCSKCNESIGFLRQKQCYYCYNYFCNSCISTRAARIIEFVWDKPSTVCKNCYLVLTRQAELIKNIKTGGENRKSILDSPSSNFKSDLLLSVQKSSSKMSNSRNHTNLASLAIFPSGGILASVPTDSNSPPIESILFSPEFDIDYYWYAPPNYSSVQIVIALGQKSSVSKIVLEVDKLGYSSEVFVPHIQVLGGNSVNNLKNWGIWNLLEEGETSISPFSQKEFTLKNPITSHLVCLVLSLSQLPKGTKKNLLSETRLHLGRIQVLGKALQQHTKLLNPLTYIDQSEKAHYDNLFKKGVITQRIPIKALSTHFRSSGKILDIYIEQTLVSGFTILIKHGEEGPNTQVKLVRIVGITTDSKGEMSSLKPLSKTIIPKCKANTELHFYFATPNLANIVTFEFVSYYGGNNDQGFPSKVTLFSSVQ